MLVLLAAVLLLGVVGCGATNAPLANIDAVGRDAARVEADKLACWHQAEVETGGTHSRARWMTASIGSSMTMQAASSVTAAARDQKIEQDAEACMVQRGYKVLPR